MLRREHQFRANLGRIYSFSRGLRMDDNGDYRRPDILACEAYARQTLDSIVRGPDDPFGYRLQDLWLDVYQRPWDQPTNLDELLGDLARKIGSGELKGYLEYDPNDCVFDVSGAGTKKTSSDAEAGSGEVDEARTQQTQSAVSSEDQADVRIQASEEVVDKAESSERSTEELEASIAAKQVEPESLDEAKAILERRRTEIEEKGYQQKYDEEELAHIASKGAVNERFLVRLMFKDAPSANGGTLGFERPSGRAPYFATTFDQAEAADTDPELISALFGIEDYSSDQAFSMAIIDLENMPPQAERESFVPTYEQMKAFGEKELADESDFKPGIMDAIMTPEMSEDYAAFMDEYGDTGNSPYNQKAVAEFARNKEADPEKRRLLRARHKVQLEFGANPLFTGTGLTKVDPDSRYASDIGQTHGVVESFTFERDPLTIGDLQGKGAVEVISAKPIKG